MFYPLQTVVSHWKYRPPTLYTYYTCTYITILTKKWANFTPYHNLKSNISQFFNFVDYTYRTLSCHISDKTILNKREQSLYISNSSRNLNLNYISQSPGDFSTQYHGRSHRYHGRLSPDKSSEMVLKYFVNHLQSSHNLILSQSTHLVNWIKCNNKSNAKLWCHGVPLKSTPLIFALVFSNVAHNNK